MPVRRPHHEIALSYNDEITVVAAKEEAPLRWLTEFLGPWFRRVEVPEQPPLTVRLFTGGADYSNWRRDATLLGGEVECFTLDGPPEPWALARGADGREAAFDERLGVALRPMRVPVPTVDVLVDDERPQGRAALMRVVREHAAAHAHARGDLPLHAAGVVAHGKATLFVGPRRAGKSTQLLHALTSPGARILTNDRAFARIEDNAAVVSGMPTIVSLRQETVARHPALQRALAGGAWYYPATVAECQAHSERGTRVQPPSSRPVPGLSGQQLATLLAIELSVKAPCTRLVFPSVDGPTSKVSSSAARLEPLSPADSARRLLLHGLTAGGRRAEYLPLPASTTPSSQLAGRVRAWTELVQSFVLHLPHPEAGIRDVDEAPRHLPPGTGAEPQW